MLEKTKVPTVNRFPTCPHKCKARMFPSGYLMSNGSKAHIWRCDECRAYAMSIVARALVEGTTRIILEYERALEYVLLEEEIEE